MEMANVVADLRKVTREYGVCVANAATYVNSRYVHMAVMTRPCGKMDDVAKVENVMAGPSPPHEVQEEYISWDLDDSGWV
jgi:hypothetical protein